MDKKFWAFLILFVPAIAIIIARAVIGISFNAKCSGHLKRAADANTIEIAEKELATAVEYLEKTGRTSGYTSVLYKTPDEDVEFWYKNLKSALEELRKVRPDATQLERTNVLMKLRETLLDSDQGSSSITEPDGISVFPSNKTWALGFFFATLLLGAGCLWLQFLEL